MVSEITAALEDLGKEKRVVPECGVHDWATAMAMRVHAALRHWSQSVMRRRQWVPKEFLPQVAARSIYARRMMQHQAAAIATHQSSHARRMMQRQIVIASHGAGFMHGGYGSCTWASHTRIRECARTVASCLACGLPILGLCRAQNTLTQTILRSPTAHSHRPLLRKAQATWHLRGLPRCPRSQRLRPRQQPASRRSQDKQPASRRSQGNLRFLYRRASQKIQSPLRRKPQEQAVCPARN